MKKVMYIALAIVFYAAGVVGLALPVVPQVPFFVIGTIMLMHGSKRFEMWVKNTKLYREYVPRFASKSKFLTKVLEVVP